MTDSEKNSFLLADNFQPSIPSGGIGLGVLENQYQELFAEALEDGVITKDERERLVKAAENLGLGEDLLSRLEDAMTAAYETHHRIRVHDRSKAPIQSLSPLAAAPSPSVAAIAPTAAADTEEVSRLREENAQLRERVVLLEAELDKAQAAVNVEVDLGGLEDEVARSETPDEAWKRVRRDPLDPEAYQTLYRAYHESGLDDGAYLAAQALAYLNAASPEQAQFVAAHRRTDLVSPRCSIDAQLWESCVYHPDEDQVTGAIFSVVAPAMLVGRVTTLRRDGELRKLAEDRLQDPSQSTVMAVRATAWASSLLGLPLPPVYVDPDSAQGYEHVAAVPPVSAIGRAALSGRTAPQLAFMVGRHLSGYRGEHFVKTLFSATEDLEDLFLAALLIANPKLPITGSPRARIEPLARAIEPLLEAAQLDSLRGHYLRFADEGGRTNLQRWSLAVDKTAARAGLALSQDLPSALLLLEDMEGKNGPLALDLLSYWTSERFVRLRRALAIGVDAE